MGGQSLMSSVITINIEYTVLYTNIYILFLSELELCFEETSFKITLTFLITQISCASVLSDLLPFSR